MAIDTSELERGFNLLFDSFERKDPVFYGRMVGESSKGDRYVTVDMLNPNLGTGVRRDVRRGKAFIWPGVVVRMAVDRKKFGPDDLAVVAVNEDTYSGYNIPSLLEPHGPSHSFKAHDEVPNLHPYQFFPVSARPYSGLTVEIQPGTYFADDAFRDLVDAKQVDFTGNLPAAGNYHFVTLSLQADNTATLTNGTARASGLTAEDIALPPEGEFLVCAIKLASFTTTITRDLIEPLWHLTAATIGGIDTTYLNKLIASAVGSVEHVLSHHMIEG